MILSSLNYFLSLVRNENISSSPLVNCQWIANSSFNTNIAEFSFFYIPKYKYNISIASFFVRFHKDPHNFKVSVLTLAISTSYAISTLYLKRGHVSDLPR